MKAKQSKPHGASTFDIRGWMFDALRSPRSTLGAPSSILVLLLLLTARTGNASAATRYVDANSASPTPPYSNWATAARVIHDAVDAAAPGDEIDLTTDVAGLDTVVTRYGNRPPGGALELWTINGGSHIPTFSADFTPRVIDWLLAHPKP